MWPHSQAIGETAWQYEFKMVLAPFWQQKHHTLQTIRSPPSPFAHYFESKVGRRLILEYLVSIDYMPSQTDGLRVDAVKFHDGLAVAIQTVLQDLERA